jgi:hypothetical protein
MKQKMVRSLLIAMAIVVTVAMGIIAAIVLLRQSSADVFAGNCNTSVVDQYLKVRDSIVSEIADPGITRYDCGDGGYPILEFKLQGDSSKVLKTLQCTSIETWANSVVYRCRSPRIGYLNVAENGSAKYNFGS